MVIVPDLFPPHYLVQTLGINSQRIRSFWQFKGLPTILRPIKRSENLRGGKQPHRLIRYEDWEVWCKENPSEVSGLSADRLQRTLRDEALIQHILTLAPIRHQGRRPVPLTRVFPDVKEFRSIRDAADGSYLSLGGLSAALARMRRNGDDRVECGGFEFIVGDRRQLQ